MSIRNHNWDRGESLQWSSLGYSYESAQTVYFCKNCGIKFIHYYHTEPNIYKAFDKSGLPKECKIKE